MHRWRDREYNLFLKPVFLGKQNVDCNRNQGNASNACSWERAQIDERALMAAYYVSILLYDKIKNMYQHIYSHNNVTLMIKYYKHSTTIITI